MYIVVLQNLIFGCFILEKQTLFEIAAFLPLSYKLRFVCMYVLMYVWYLRLFTYDGTEFPNFVIYSWFPYRTARTYPTIQNRLYLNGALKKGIADP